MLCLNRKIRIGTRASNLAIAQANNVKKLIMENLNLNENLIEIIPFNTSGDIIKNRSLHDIGGKGLFVKEIEDALIHNKIDIAVHSAKDVPPQIHKSTKIGAYTERKDVRDCFISNKYNKIEDLPIGATIGTSSPRRKFFLLKLRPDLNIVNFRGNVDSRIKKIENNIVDGSVLALCGLQRLGKEATIKDIIDTNIMPPPGGQGSLIIQVRKLGIFNFFQYFSIEKILRKINHDESSICISLERYFLRLIEASCSTPVSVYCKIDGDKLFFSSEVFLDNAEEKINTIPLSVNETFFAKNTKEIKNSIQNFAKKVRIHLQLKSE